jgi:Arc/MetJ-type ribon-helix-helix transcriptional regulator
MHMTDRTTLRLPDERKRKIDRAREIVAADDHDDPPMSDVIDAALTHLIESEQNIDDARDDHDPRVIQEIANTSVLGLHYRTEIRDKWR